MTIHYDDLENVLGQTDIALVVEILSAGSPAREGFHLSLELTATPLASLFGHFDGEVLACTYSQGLPHLRGQTHVWPRVSGSGLEVKLQPGDRAIFLLSSSGALLRAESLDNADRISARGQAPPGMDYTP
jgi:hypothetical protein